MSLGVVVGSYEHTIYGYALDVKDFGEDTEGEEEKRFRSAFSLPVHGGCIKSIASSGKWVASGGSDEIISVMDLEQDGQVCVLQQHSGDVTSLAFHSDKFLYSASLDGTIAIFRTSDWELLSSLKAHKGGVTSIAVHPSGKVALSVGKDNTMKIWNMLTFKCALTTTQRGATFCGWCPSGDRYAVVADRTLFVHVLGGGLEKKMVQETPILCFAFISETQVATGGNDGYLRVWDIPSAECKLKLKGPGDRIRGLDILPGSPHPLAMTASSNGTVSVWELNEAHEEGGRLLMSSQVPARLTCLAISGRVLHADYDASSVARFTSQVQPAPVDASSSSDSTPSSSSASTSSSSSASTSSSSASTTSSSAALSTASTSSSASSSTPGRKRLQITSHKRRDQVAADQKTAADQSSTPGKPGVPKVTLKKRPAPDSDDEDDLDLDMEFDYDEGENDSDDEQERKRPGKGKKQMAKPGGNKGQGQGKGAAGKGQGKGQGQGQGKSSAGKGPGKGQGKSPAGKGPGKGTAQPSPKHDASSSNSKNKKNKKPKVTGRAAQVDLSKFD
eukprot:TRINITY_DN8904_c0_g2_i1.p1 TRINITY_DN8904_c0_g2~~TRINITY_DN8904_c0_g2_i1.p1  ORF type:complete len:584 (-),score=148.24 TRINITY_DN8904_c0_g2_i1:11-1687(-)